MARREELSNEQWSLIEPLFDKPPVVATRGRPRRSEREVLNGVLWILRSGARWCDLPDRFPPYQTCHRRFREWIKDGRLRKVLETLAEDLHSRGKLDLSECFIDGTFVSAKKGAHSFGKTKRGKGTKFMAVADRAGLPVAVHTCSASPHEVKLVSETVCQRFTDERPKMMIGDKAYDSDPLDAELRKLEIELIAPHKANRKKARTQDGRKLRRYKRRWKIERLFAWLQNFRRIVVRYEYHSDNYLGFVHLACIVILLRNYF
ncbi:MAG: IS5 family transposase [Acidobacteriota bacterium]|nr:IS5 family transposase [Acidobacteriota bacterium]